MKLLLSLVLVFLILAGTTCGRKQCVLMRSHPETMKYCSFKPGTWWIYESTKNYKDTWRVFKSWTGTTDSRSSDCATFTDYMIATSFDTFSCHISGSVASLLSNKNMGEAQLMYTQFADARCNGNTLSIVRVDSAGGEPIRKEFRLGPGTCAANLPFQSTWELHTGMTQMIYANGDTLNLVDRHTVQ